jgi:hypothetical protein
MARVEIAFKVGANFDLVVGWYCCPLLELSQSFFALATKSEN